MSLEERKLEVELLHKRNFHAVEKQLAERDETIAAMRKEIDEIEIPDGSCPICFEEVVIWSKQY